MTDQREFLYRELEAALATAAAASGDLLEHGPNADNVYDLETAIERATQVLGQVQALPRGPKTQARA